jgi:DNA helicase-2/ATP-dependent DNA helicase PcrA
MERKPSSLIAERIIEDRIIAVLKKRNELTADDRALNLDEMINAIREFDEENQRPIEAFFTRYFFIDDAYKRQRISKE